MVKKTRIVRVFTVYSDQNNELIGTWNSANELLKDLKIKSPEALYRSIRENVYITPYLKAPVKYRIEFEKRVETYKVDSGKVRNLGRKYIKVLPKGAKESVNQNGKGLYLTPNGKIFGTDNCGWYEIKPYLNTYDGVKNGYYKFHYKSHMFNLHYEIARLFVDGYQPGLCVDHVNNDSTDNRIENLQWVTRGQNTEKFWSTLSEKERIEYRKIYSEGLKKAHREGKYDAHTKRLSEMLKNRPRGPMSDETKEKISKANKGRHSGRSKPVLQYNRDGVLIKEHDSIQAAANELGIDRNTISHALTGITRSAGGFIWQFK